MQGSTYDNIFLDNQSIDACCSEESSKRQLQYVALSRASNNVYILQ